MKHSKACFACELGTREHLVSKYKRLHGINVCFVLQGHGDKLLPIPVSASAFSFSVNEIVACK